MLPKEPRLVMTAASSLTDTVLHTRLSELDTLGIVFVSSVFRNRFCNLLWLQNLTRFNSYD